MVVGIGTDILGVARMERELGRPQGGFRDGVFTPAEIADCERNPSPARHYAVRFAAKEALFKALRTGWSGGLSWTEAEVRTRGGSPELVLHGAVKELAGRMQVARVFLSWAHTGQLAVACVVLEA